MASSSVADRVQKRSGAYWRDLVFSRLLPAVFFSLFLARQLLFVWDSLHAIHRPSDYLFVIQQLLALAYFTMLVVLYSTRLPKVGTDHRAAVVFIAFTGTFSAIAAPFMPGGSHREGLVLVGDLLATAGLAYSVWGLAYLRRSFSIVPEARRLVTGGPYSLSRHPVYLGEIVAARGAFWAVLAEEEHRRFDTVIRGDPIIVTIGAEELAACVDTLLGNVFAHTPEGTAFRVTVDDHALAIEDDGPGLADGPIAVRGRSGGGSTGLGLDIARTTAEHLGGRLHLGSGTLGGARVEIRFGASDQYDRPT